MSSRRYAWAAWFRGLARSIADGGEGFLSENAAKVNWKTGKGKAAPLVKAGPTNIDPLSFFNCLAGRDPAGACSSTSAAYAAPRASGP